MQIKPTLLFILSAFMASLVIASSVGNVIAANEPEPARNPPAWKREPEPARYPPDWKREPEPEAARNPPAWKREEGAKPVRN